VLVMGGSQGLGPTDRTVKWLDRATGDFTIEVVAGKQSGAGAASRRRVAPVSCTRLRVHGLVKNVADRMHRADLMVSKAGGMTCAEALCAGLPMIIAHPLPGQEARNTEVLVQQGAAIHVQHDRDIRWHRHPVVSQSRPAGLPCARKRVPWRVRMPRGGLPWRSSPRPGPPIERG